MARNISGRANPPPVAATFWDESCADCGLIKRENGQRFKGHGTVPHPRPMAVIFVKRFRRKLDGTYVGVGH